MITAAHIMINSKDADGVRALLRDVLGFKSIDAGDGWIIFALPPSELAVHPTDGETEYELYLMCDDIHATMKELKEKGAEIGTSISDEGWGMLVSIQLPGGGKLGLYEPRHPTTLDLTS